MQIIGRAGVLGGILFLTLLFNPVPALSAALTGPYSANLAWDASADPGVMGYRIYFGVSSGNYTDSIDAGNLTTSAVSGLSSGARYYFVVTAVDAQGIESLPSNEISFVPGIPSVQISVAPDRQVSLRVTGLIGHTYYIQASETLTDWPIIFIVTLGPSASFDYIDVNAASFPKRFYRTYDPYP